MQLDRLGPYKIVKQIGKGGMGAVYEAIADRPGAAEQGRRVAIKALSPQMAAAEGFRERFESEIVSMMQLSHEGIVQIYGKGEQDGILFYSMELVDGTSLEEEISAGRRFNWRETLRVGIQICRALKHAHDVGVVHRDIKPANLLLTTEGRVKIADFGIARFFHNTQLTTAGGVLGTADYMSPEQADGRQVTEKCDQYSLGGVMYALLAGRPPFQAKTMPEMLQLQRFAEPEPVRRYASETPDQLNNLIAQLLAKEPESRFPNVMVLGRHMEAMEKALSKRIEGQAVGPQPTDHPQKPTAELSAQQTRAAADSAIDKDETKSEPISTDIYDAATLDVPADGDPYATISDVPLTHEPLRSTFTTIDEEKRRQQNQSSNLNWGLYAQFLLLVLLITVIVWGGWQVMKPHSADDLYEIITQTVEDEGNDGLRNVSRDLKQFAERFPEDPRNQELDGYRKRLEFLRFEKQARAKSRVGSSEAASPVGRVYLDATRQAELAPFEALRTLEAVVRLYDPMDEIREETATGEADSNAKLTKTDRRWLLLARQKIVELRNQLGDDAKQQLPALRERLAAAQAMNTTTPAKAKEMFQAIIQIYGNEPWAREIVAQARTALSAPAEETSP